MQIDRQSLNKLLSMNDRQLTMVINKIARESGIDPSVLNINPNDISSIRSALSSATDEDLRRLTQEYGDLKNKKGDFRR